MLKKKAQNQSAVFQEDAAVALCGFALSIFNQVLAVKYFFMGIGFSQQVPVPDLSLRDKFANRSRQSVLPAVSRHLRDWECLRRAGAAAQKIS